MAGDKDTLLNMGFDAARVEWALKATGNRGLQPAMDHILEHDGQPIPDSASITEQTASSAAPMNVDNDGDEDMEALTSLGVLKGSGAAIAAAAAPDAEAKSIKCSECGKIFKDTALANFHAEKSGHDQFEESTEEIKPLTEEEKKQKLEELKEKLLEKRAVKAVEQSKEHKANEALRRKAGKDLHKIKEDLQAKELIKEAEAKRREKLEDAKARAAIKAQIEADKKARAEKFAREKAIRDGQVIEATPVAAPATPATVAGTTTSSTEAKDTRLQIRLSTGGPPLTTTLSSDAPLREVAEYIASQSLNFNVETVTLAQHFPRKTFVPADFSKSLRDLGLTPSAVIIATP